ADGRGGVGGTPPVANAAPLPVGPGGILPVRSAGDLLPGVAGRYRHRLDVSGNAALEVDTGSAWRPVLPQVLPGTCVARLRRTTSSTVANNAAIPWDAEDWDTLSAHASGASQYIPTVAGRYLVTAVVRHPAITAGASITADIRLNGAVTATAGTSAHTAPSAGPARPATGAATC